jgi:hypothetical protein
MIGFLADSRLFAANALQLLEKKLLTSFFINARWHIFDQNELDH